jgi:hypothetical protein
MASSAQVLAAGIAFIGCTFTLIVSAYLGDMIFHPIFSWMNSFQYSSAPPLDPGMMSWIPRLYFGLLILMWLALLFALASMAMNKVTYQYPGGPY